MRQFVLGSDRQSEIEFTVLARLTLKSYDLFVRFNNGFCYKHTESDAGLILAAAAVALVESLKDIGLVIIVISAIFYSFCANLSTLAVRLGIVYIPGM